ncbi:hypothetical protein M8J76_013765 [Diaphorina citri]|nr:hypothetical protein M8J75_015290 [Diaphorina citri]KAI5722797.1 hypothetical protein M8J76_013765 [Diaphorina citri]
MALKNNPGSGCSISEVSSLVKNAHNVIAQMKLMSVKPELSPEDYAWFSRNKTELSKVLNQLSHLDPTLVGKMRRRQKKLDKARGGSFEPVTPRLSAELCRLRERIERDGDGLDREEWSEFLFNTSCERTLSPETLLKIR